MTETPSVPEQVWNPLDQPAVKTVKLKTAEAHGVDMSITVRRWTGRERLAYDDLQATRFLQRGDDDETSGYLIGTATLCGAALTIVGSSGFPAVDGRDFLTGSVDDKLGDLQLITDQDLFDEVADVAIGYQPLPGSVADRERKAKALATREGKPVGGDDEDPSRMPSTPPEATTAPATPESPTE